MNISIWLIICLILATASIVAVAVYLIIVLIQLKKTTKEMEVTLSKVNSELDMINKVSGKVVNITEKLSNPFISAGAVLYYIFSSFKKKKDGCK
ncbi:MAG: DUF948 domain-containing protein [Endomicrobia bacterium]|nr:DUF948 domain-containing protein [Endomicrobiia bacterium]